MNDRTLQLGLASARLFPATRKIVAEAYHPGLADGSLLPLGFDPGTVLLHRASGGFNCVIEISAARCLRQVVPALTVPPFTVTVPPETVQETLSGMGRPSRLEELSPEALEGMGSSFEDLDVEYFSVITVRPIGLSFPAPDNVNLVLAADLRHYARVAPAQTGLDRRLIAIGRHAGFGGRPAGFEPRTVPIGRIGHALLNVSGAYRALPDAPHARVDIVIDGLEPAGPVEYSSDTVREFFEENLSPELSNGFDRVLGTSGVRLTPTLSLTGSSPAYFNVTEFAAFDVSVFHVQTSQNRQAIVAAFDLLPGCHGIIEDVEHFIGNRDYGVIMDEYTVERAFKFKWRIGGFDRSLKLSTRIEIARDGNPEDAELRGRLELLSLDLVSFSTDSETRQDHIRLGGQARAVPTSIVLGDGTVVGPDQVDFGDPEASQWGMATLPVIVTALSPDPEIRQFQERAHRDAYRHIGRPFAHFTLRDGSVVPEYSRLEAVTKHVFVLGQLPYIF